MKKALNIALVLFFLLTILVPLTGMKVHKIASTLFLLLSIIHTICYHKKLSRKRWLLLALITLCFITGIPGMIIDGITLILALHKVFSMAVIFFLAIHLFVYRHKLT